MSRKPTKEVHVFLHEGTWELHLNQDDYAQIFERLKAMFPGEIGGSQNGDDSVLKIDSSRINQEKLRNALSEIGFSSSWPNDPAAKVISLGT